MDLELFRHNHARFIGLDVISMAFAKAHRDSSFSYEEFERAVSSSSSGGQYSKKRTIKMARILSADDKKVHIKYNRAYFSRNLPFFSILSF
jgi:hypothetical protein